MVAAGAFAARDTGFLRTPGWPTRKLIWANWGAPERSNRKRDRCSVQAAAQLGILRKMGSRKIRGSVLWRLVPRPGMEPRRLVLQSDCP